jgi:hypothetical protein
MACWAATSSSFCGTSLVVRRSDPSGPVPGSWAESPAADVFACRRQRPPSQPAAAHHETVRCSWAVASSAGVSGRGGLLLSSAVLSSEDWKVLLGLLAFKSVSSRGLQSSIAHMILSPSSDLGSPERVHNTEIADGFVTSGCRSQP